MRGGEPRWRTFDITLQDLVADPAIGALVLTGHDVTERLRMQSEMAHRALHDALTGLPNRALLADRFDRALTTSRRDGTVVGLLLVDLARLGGDEFAVLLPDIGHLEAATAVAHKLQAALTQAFFVGGVELDIEASIGVVVSGEHGGDATTLAQGYHLSPPLPAAAFDQRCADWPGLAGLTEEDRTPMATTT